MKTRYSDLIGKQINLSAHDAALQLMLSVCESISCSEVNRPVTDNLFDRGLSFSSSADVSFSTGFAATGLRTGTILRSKDLPANLDNITYAVRTHVPLVIIAFIGSQTQINQIVQTGSVVFSACSGQELLDLLLASYQIAELSLLPVVVCYDETLNQQEEYLSFPDKKTILSLAGNPDILIESPTPSQVIIFGKNRKRIPNWFNPDNPVSTGESKLPHEAALETAANEAYFYNHLDGFITDAFLTLFSNTGRRYEILDAQRAKDVDYAIISQGIISKEVVKAIDIHRSSSKIKIASARLIQVGPFPSAALKTFLATKKCVTILEQAVTGVGHSPIFKEIACIPEARKLMLISGNYGSVPVSGDILEVIKNMLKGNDAKLKFRTGFHFTRPDSKYPKHQVLMQAIEREYPDIEDEIVSPKPASDSILPHAVPVPLSIRKYKDQVPPYARLSRFFDNTGSLYVTDPAEITADPFQAIPVLPPSTAHFNYSSSESGQKHLPKFYSEMCTGCGDCFLHCPHSTINPLVIGIENLLKAATAISNANGVKITQLTPHLKNISKNIHEVINQNNGEITSITDIITCASENVITQLQLADEKADAVRIDVDALTKTLKDLSFSVTDLFYNSREILKKGTGELFTLVVDANACTGCGVCTAACDEDALKMTESYFAIIAEHDVKYAVWEQLPDTTAATITRLLDEKEYNPFSAILLSRYFNQALNGISLQNNDDASKSIVHLINAIAEAAIQPRIKDTAETIDQLISDLSSKIHDQLGAALPSTDFSGLSKALLDIKGDKKTFDVLIETLGTKENLKQVDTRSLKRKVELVNSLKTLKWLLSEGPTGMGRARLGFALDSTLNWSDDHPWNNFTSPVMIQLSGKTTELANGIIQGQTRQLLDNIKILRRARLEINDTYEPEINDKQIASITWDDLSETEKNMVPPVIVIGKRENLAGANLNSLVKLLGTNWPLKAIVLDDAAPSVDQATNEIKGGIGLLLPALALQNATILKSSIADPFHMFTGLTELFRSHKPALSWIYTPDISKHQLPQMLYHKLYPLSLNSRAFPLFHFNPDKEGNLLASKIDTNGNPQCDLVWPMHNLCFKVNGEENSIAYSITWADWAYTLKSWTDEFILFNDVMGKPILVAEYISYSKSEQAGKVPVIIRIDGEGAGIKYKVSEAVILVTRACSDAWHLLREISGELSEFPEKLHIKVASELAVQYEQKLNLVNDEFKSKIQNMEQEHLKKMREKIKEKLMTLAQSSNGN